jgi:Ice-binding-like
VSFPTKFLYANGRFCIASLAAAGLLVALPGNAQAASGPVPLGTAGSFVVLAGGGVTNTGPTTLNGDIGTFPTTTITGPGSLTVTGTNHHGDAVTQGAKTDLVTGYNNATGQGPALPIAGDLTDKTLTRGVYKSESSIGLTGQMTLDAKNDPNAVFVFQAGSTLTTGSGSKVTLINGASPCNVFWQVGTSATLGTGSTFVGSILAMTSITATTKATVDGRLLARNGAVTLDTNKITKPACTKPAALPAATPTTTPTATPTATRTATPTAKTTPQVRHVPTGGIDTGGGSTSAGQDDTAALMTGGVVLAGAGGATIVALRRRRLNA